LGINHSFMRIIFLLLVILAFSSCKHDLTNPDGSIQPNPGEPCDTSLVYFDTQVLPILRANCAMSGCHDDVSRQDGVVLTSYQQVMQTADVRPNNLSGSDLYEVITESRDDKVMPPPPRPRLSAEQTALIARWIMQGAKQLQCDANSGVCDTMSMSFAQHIKPIIQQQCLGCHGNVNPGGGFNFNTHAGVAASVAQGRLLGSITHQAGFKAMPQGGAKINDCYIRQISAWINAGAPNN
jgi:mono/diheme cytochrome c family protein